MIKYTTALRLGTAETEAIVPLHQAQRAAPDLQGLCRTGKAIKTIFLCQYLHSKELRRDIDEGLNVVEQWNGATDFVFFAPRRDVEQLLEDQEDPACSRRT